MHTFALLASLAVGASAGTISAPFVKQKLSLDSSVHKRDTLTLTALNNITGGGYYSEFEIGTPGQKISFHLDTGSSDTWVNSVDTDLCNSERLQESTGPCLATYNPDKSSTYKLVGQDEFDISYLDTRQITGDYFNDTVTIDGKSVKKQQLGLAVKSLSATGIMGLGFSTGVAGNKTYPAIVENMESQGLIERAVYSLWLNDLDSEEGTILFGGIDTQKFVGKLATLPLLPLSKDRNITAFAISLKSLGVTMPSGENNLKLDDFRNDTLTIVDSGSTACQMPDSQVEEIYKAFDVVSIKEVPTPFVNCAYGKSKGKGITFDFKFDGKTIAVPMKEMVINAFEEQQDVFKDPLVASLFKDWDGVCMFGISPISKYGVSSGTLTLLGDTFLRSAYVVYDLTNEQLGIAAANHRSNNSDIVELKKGDTKLPNVSGVEKASTFDDDDDDNAAGHLSPAFMVTFFMVAGVALTLW
ncbi:SAP3-like protein [Fusarium heterosporum]|uniref:SAP3-like protein n=1 Tax=Fusarium heterosporum TaxID=42747 RepID=A0A8H5WUC5_FUSHE|nr:SAP3-like protein [Fusarium heterosporum]